MLGPIILVLMIMGYAGLIKLCARLLKGSIVSWKDCFIFSAIFVAISMAFRIYFMSNNVTIPIAVTLVNGFVLQLGLGAWFFRNRATDNTGNALGWRGGMKLMTIGSTVIVLLGFLYFAKNAIGR